MRRTLHAWAIAGAMLLVACGRRDASGVYLAKTDRQAVLVQLTQAPDGGLAGHVEAITIGPGGLVNDESTTLDAGTSQHPLASLKGAVLTFRRNGADVRARKASLAAFQTAVAHLKRQAELERHRAGDARPAQAVDTGQASAFETAADKSARLGEAAAELRGDAARLNDAVSAAPDFGRQSTDNTARLAAMAQQARALARPDRSRLAASANQVIVATNQIDVARTRYAIDLDKIIARAAPLAMAVERFCDTPQAAALKPSCAQADSAATAFEAALVHGSVVFKGYKQTIQTELSRQAGLVQQIGG